VEPEIEDAGADDDDDERDGDRTHARLEEGHEVIADDPLRSGSQGQGDPVQDAECRQGGDE
jgi:hypothetical protein